LITNYGVAGDSDKDSSQLNYSTPRSGGSDSPDPFKMTSSAKLLMMKGLDIGSTEAFMKRYFELQGLSIAKVKVHRDALQVPTGNGYVEFTDTKDADYAFNVLNGTIYDDKKTKLRLSYK
jgi:RNA recognition motif-containing protein